MAVTSSFYLRVLLLVTGLAVAGCSRSPSSRQIKPEDSSALPPEPVTSASAAATPVPPPLAQAFPTMFVPEQPVPASPAERLLAPGDSRLALRITEPDADRRAVGLKALRQIPGVREVVFDGTSKEVRIVRTTEEFTAAQAADSLQESGLKVVGEVMSVEGNREILIGCGSEGYEAFKILEKTPGVVAVEQFIPGRPLRVLIKPGVVSAADVSAVVARTVQAARTGAALPPSP